MNSLEIGTVAKVGSSSLYCPNTYQIKLDSFGRVAQQMSQVSNAVLVSSGAYLAGKALDRYEDDTGYLTAIGWKKLLDQWESAFGEPMPSVLAEEIHFHNAVAGNGEYEPARFQHIVKTFQKAWEKEKVLITNQNDPVSKVGLAPDILEIDDGKPEFHGDNDLYAAEITRALLKQKTLKAVNFIILSGSGNGITGSDGKTRLQVGAAEIRDMITEGASASRAGANGFKTKGEALLRALEAGADVYLGSAERKTSILETTGHIPPHTITQIVDTITEI